jgi:hypothetical protein
VCLSWSLTLQTQVLVKSVRHSTAYHEHLSSICAIKNYVLGQSHKSFTWWFHLSKLFELVIDFPSKGCLSSRSGTQLFITTSSDNLGDQQLFFGFGLHKFLFRNISLAKLFELVVKISDTSDCQVGQTFNCPSQPPMTTCAISKYFLPSITQSFYLGIFVITNSLRHNKKYFAHQHFCSSTLQTQKPFFKFWFSSIHHFVFGFTENVFVGLSHTKFSLDDFSTMNWFELLVNFSDNTCLSSQSNTQLLITTSSDNLCNR